MSQAEFAALIQRSPSIIATVTDSSIRSILDKECKQNYKKYRNTVVYCYENGAVSYGEKLTNCGEMVDKFDSIKEYERFIELTLLQKAKKISCLRKQVPFVIQEAFTRSNGENVKAIIYRADFVYDTPQDGTVVEDVKTFDKLQQKYRTTKDFNLKWKLLQKQYKNITFRLY